MANGVETEYVLYETATGTIPASGNLEFEFRPNNFDERWSVDRISTEATTNARLSVYRNYVSQQTLIDTTVRANADISNNVNQEVRPGEKIIARYTRGVTGATVSVRLEGRRYIKGRRAY